jgi:co-chaperonin GroES (HSP10)
MVNEESFIPLRASILVRRDEAESELDGIIIPEAWRTYGWRAVVLRCGPKVEGFKVGDAILFKKEFTVLPFKNRMLAITDSKQVLAKLTVAPGTDYERIEPQNEYVFVEPHPIPHPSSCLHLSDRAADQPKMVTGDVLRVGARCSDLKPGDRIMFQSDVGVVCNENGVAHRLIGELSIAALLVQ